MAEKKLARRYANSLLGLAVERGEEQAVFDDMSLVARACAGSRDLSLFLKNPVIHTDKKDKVIRALFLDKLSELSFSFMQVITRKRRERYLEEIADEYVLLYKVKKGIATAVITSAVPLDRSLQDEVTAFLADRTHRKIELTQKTDPAIIGGYILRWGDEQVDASISRKLRELKRSFEPNLYIKDF
jgi:F-type H+-transporting ATPase subunit delta